MKNLVRILVIAVAVSPQLAHACAACMGDPNTNIAKGANAAIYVMLGLLAGVFGFIGAFIYSLYRRSKMPLPPHAELGETLNAQP